MTSFRVTIISVKNEDRKKIDTLANKSILRNKLLTTNNLVYCGILVVNSLYVKKFTHGKMNYDSLTGNNI